MNDLKGKMAVITGAASGIGRALALQLGQEGCALMEGIIAIPNHCAYVSSKFALRGFTEVLKLDLRWTRVGVSCVFPGAVRTNIVRNSMEFARKYLEDHPELSEEFEPRLRRAEALVDVFESVGTSPEDAARIIIEGIKKKQWRILIGQDAVGLDGLQRSNPEGYQEVLLTILPKEFLES